VVQLQPGYADCFALLGKQVDAVTTDDVILISLLSRDPDNFKLTGRPFSKEPYGMGIKKGRVGFKDFIDGVISDIKEDGTWKKIYDKWIKPLTGESASPPPDEVVAEAPTASPS
jgi:glutamate transport system substrate-binding protein